METSVLDWDARVRVKEDGILLFVWQSSLRKGGSQMTRSREPFSAAAIAEDPSAAVQCARSPQVRAAIVPA